jgi:hypothetical protein
MFPPNNITGFSGLLNPYTACLTEYSRCLRFYAFSNEGIKVNNN